MERTASEPHRIAVLSSGISRGSNLQAIHSYLQAHEQRVQIALAVFTRKASPAFAQAQSLGICTALIAAKDMAVFEDKLLELIQLNSIELLALAGFMKCLSAGFITNAAIPILNIHPALLPKFGGKGMFGMAVHEAVYAAGERVSGATIHLVNPQYDKGAILAQKVVNISICKNPAEIAKVVLKAEHELYAPTICKVLLNN